MTSTERSRRWRALRRSSVAATKSASNKTGDEMELVEAKRRIAELESRLRAECASNRAMRAKIATFRDAAHMEVANGQGL
ncbi:MAG: hypothetical protein ACR65W_07485 [Methylocystis sp.]|uniref:hypothetical protein n=1 Tax=Methylocystis sp. TaxID=1911079 RepID=UPI003DA68257